MLEIFALYQLCKTNRRIVTEKGRSSGSYTALTVGLWIGMELIGIVIGSASGMEGGTYLLGLIFAGIGGAIAYTTAKNVSPLGAQTPMAGMQYNPLFPKNTQPMAQAASYAQQPMTQAAYYAPQPVAGSFCTRCGARLVSDAIFCPACGVNVSAQRPAPVTQNNTTREAAYVPVQQVAVQKNIFYVFAVQGPAFGMATGGDIVLEKAQALKNGYEPAADMELKLIRPSMWNARVQNRSSSGMISVDYSMDSFKDEIRRYLATENIASDMIEDGLRISEEKSLQLMNPMSGVYVMGIPVLYPEEQSNTMDNAQCDNSPEPSMDQEQVETVVSPSACSHQYRHFICTKCGQKAPKPQLIPEGTRAQNQYTYEYYRASSAEEARYFLELTEVTLPLYYVMVHTPEGTWGRDKDGIFLESLCDFQRNVSLAQCEANTALFPQRLQDLQLAANKITDNYILSITCGNCGYEWVDGVGYRTKTVVKCPDCGKYNLVDTENIRVNNL